jgi:uncharacterized protein (TIGR03086 family)
MDLLRAHRSATRQFDNRIRLVRDAQWDNATPCADWDVRRLADHVVDGQWQAVALLGGEPGSADAGGDPLARWDAAAAAAADAWNAAGVRDREVVLPTGPMSAELYLERRVVELTVHAWDLARAIGADDEVPNDLAAVALDIVQRRESEWSASGRFGTSLLTVMCADDLTELLARLGRARWKSFTPATMAR